jgi:multimeric flavodoxin WrbA
MSQRPAEGIKRVLVLSSSPRRDGNSRQLADAALDGVREAGHTAELVHLDDHLGAFLRDCRLCRSADGHCTIDDGFDALFRERFLPADGVVLATPIYWYGVSGQLKTFFDRMFCYIAASHPENEKIAGSLVGKRLALLLSSEESYTGASLGVLHEIQEYARYTHSPFVGFVQGIGNKRGDVLRDPGDPAGRARELGRRLFSKRSTDYRLDTPRAGSVWADADPTM